MIGGRACEILLGTIDFSAPTDTDSECDTHFWDHPTNPLSQESEILKSHFKPEDTFFIDAKKWYYHFNDISHLLSYLKVIVI